MEYRVKNAATQEAVLAICNVLTSLAQDAKSITYNGRNYQVWYVVTPQRAEEVEAAISTVFAKLL